MNYFKQKLGLYTQIGVITQSDNREITQNLGFHIRCVQLKQTKNMERILTLLSILLIATNLNAQDACESCLGKPEWKVERTILDSTDIQMYPFNSIIKLNVKRWYNFLGPHYGTASFLNDSILITAHHNLVRKAHITKIWYLDNGKNVELRKRDFEIIYYQQKLNTKTDIAVIKITNPDKIIKRDKKFEISENVITNIQDSVNLTGFPCDYSGLKMLNKSTVSTLLKISSDLKLIGYPLYTCTGDSGAPLWVKSNGKFYLIGIHHGGNENITDFSGTQYNVSVYVNSDIIKWISSITN